MGWEVSGSILDVDKKVTKHLPIKNHERRMNKKKL